MRECPFCKREHGITGPLLGLPNDAGLIGFEVVLIECDCGATWALDESYTHGRPKKYAKKGP